MVVAFLKIQCIQMCVPFREFLRHLFLLDTAQAHEPGHIAWLDYDLTWPRSQESLCSGQTLAEDLMLIVNRFFTYIKTFLNLSIGWGVFHYL